MVISHYQIKFELCGLVFSVSKSDPSSWSFSLPNTMYSFSSLTLCSSWGVPLGCACLCACVYDVTTIGGIWRFINTYRGESGIGRSWGRIEDCPPEHLEPIAREAVKHPKPVFIAHAVVPLSFPRGKTSPVEFTSWVSRDSFLIVSFSPWLWERVSGMELIQVTCWAQAC